MTNFFPINENTFVDFCMRDIRAIGFDNWQNTYHQHIDNMVDNNSNEENIMIINEYTGGIYEAIELYKSEYGEFEYRDKKQFYAVLAFISIYHKYIEIISDLVESETDSDSDNDNDTDLSEADTIEADIN
jgi:hypothetical protein